MPGKFIVGVDPGIFGAVAIIRPGPVVVQLSALPAGAGELATMLRLIDEPRGAIECVAVESQTAMPRQGRTSIASQMRGYGQILGVCAGLVLPVRTIMPAVWKRRVGLRLRHGDSETLSALRTEWRQDAISLRQMEKLAHRAENAAWKRESLAHARAVPNFTVCEPKRCNEALLVGMADAVLVALAVANVDPSFKAYHWRF